MTYFYHFFVWLDLNAQASILARMSLFLSYSISLKPFGRERDFYACLSSFSLTAKPLPTPSTCLFVFVTFISKHRKVRRSFLPLSLIYIKFWRTSFVMYRGKRFIFPWMNAARILFHVPPQRFIGLIDILLWIYNE